MKHKHAIEAYKLQALKGTKQGQGAEKKQTEDGRSGKLEKTADKAAGDSRPDTASGTRPETSGKSRSGQAAEGRIFRGSTINSIVNEGGLLRTGFGHKRAAKLLLLLGKEQASQVLRHLLPDEIEKSEAEKILEEFGVLAGEIAATPHGGIEVARDILLTTFGAQKSEEILRKISPYALRRPFSFLNELEFQQIMLLLRKEPVHVMSIVISYLEPSKASQVLESLPPESQALIVRRIGRLGSVSPEVISAIEESLRERIRTQGKVITEEIDGQKVLADILKHLSLRDEGRILESLEEKNKALAKEIKEKLFSIESVLEIPDIQIQSVLHKYPDRDIAAILKGKSEEIQDKLLRNVSERRREFIQNEREHLGPMKRSKVDGITRDFLSYIRERAEQGDITLKTDELI
jgi:flagellar motor switch protein FliG